MDVPFEELIFDPSLVEDVAFARLDDEEDVCPEVWVTCARLLTENRMTANSFAPYA